MSVWLLVLFAIGHEPELVAVLDNGVKCRAQAQALNSPHHAPRLDPAQRYECFVLDSAT